ncbi:tissue-resident T-cell transcription regulator protein ZNF683 [Echinops telfairi]|uniref:Tissue-resident T-cell transcription regulator protein ZNF683 n=1 Tax=Echinops telfairi TaxID=9371 RepID=A0AC55DSZ5_ECHTE|nr:tissue-resident T-cell transcription regulator protein ZNF683 [Echinops telfairi]
MRNQPLWPPTSSTEAETIVAAQSPLSRDKMRSQLERSGEESPHQPSSPHNSPSPAPWQNRRNSSPLTFCPCPTPNPISKDLPFHPQHFYSAYPLLLSPPYLFPGGALPFVQYPYLFMLPGGTPCSTVAVSRLLMTTNESGHPPQGKTLLPQPGTFHTSGQAQLSPACNPGPGTAQIGSPGLENASMEAPATWTPPGSRVGSATLPYPLKKQDGKLLYQCHVCSKNFGQLSNLKVHLRVHSGERPFQCDQCKKTFTQLAHLQKHHLVHTGEQPHECPLCHKRFRSSSNLKTHLRLHQDAPPFQCSRCPSRLAQHVHLKLPCRRHAPAALQPPHRPCWLAKSEHSREKWAGTSQHARDSQDG